MSALAVCLALASAAAWGAADFGGGLVSRRLPTLSVTVLSQAAGFAALLAALAVHGGGLDGRSFALGLAAGAGGGAGLAAFYRALALGTMSVVSPVVACGAVVPFAISLASGERPAAVALAGAPLALAGAVLASAEERRAPAGERGRAVALAAGAAGALGLFTYFLGLGSREGSALATLLGARVGSLALLVALALWRAAPLRLGRRALAPVAAVGLCDVGANALFALASGHGLLALVSVLGSLYPVTTVLLAHALLGERLTPLQLGGVGVALAGVAAVSAG
ncbi:MAG TPA: EamA family transporter [Gaiellaceae bacterium]|nr:EamA family transporter [Gaiellaceae bacterium]